MTIVRPTTDGAACREADPALFFPTTPAGEHQDSQVAAAKTLCRGCPMRQACLTHALEFSEGEGIWGGFTSRERRRLRVLAARRRALDPRVVYELRAGRAVRVPVDDRPAVVHILSRLGWSDTRIGEALGVEPFAVHVAMAAGANAAFYAAAEERCTQDPHGAVA
ncbi:WhiB family transcriptional regulator [Streptomyces sp. NPDC058686]|uniref:WhiB family transcriptional regulator n=1 Tax=Streptomyces sp. NPDC058686 TaxID=3346599 RepID=UPI00365F5676